MIIALTKKLADIGKIKLDTFPDSYDALYSWHAKDFLFGRKKGMILINDKTYYSITLYGLKAEHYKKHDRVIKGAISETFLNEGFSNETVDNYIEQCGNVVYTKTHSRKLTSLLNNFEIPISWELEDHLEIGSKNVNILGVNKFMGRFLCAGPDYVRPIEELRKEFSINRNRILKSIINDTPIGT